MYVDNLMMHARRKFCIRQCAADGMIPSNEFSYEPLHFYCLWRDMDSPHDAHIVLPEASCILVVNVCEHQAMEVKYEVIGELALRSDKPL